MIKQTIFSASGYRREIIEVIESYMKDGWKVVSMVSTSEDSVIVVVEKETE